MAGFVDDDDQELSSIFPEESQPPLASFQKSKKQKVNSLRQEVVSASRHDGFAQRFRTEKREERPSNPVPVLNPPSDGASVAALPTFVPRQKTLNPLNPPFNPFSSQRSASFPSPEMVRPTPKRTLEQERQADDYLATAFSGKTSIVDDETSNESASSRNSTNPQNSINGGRRRRLRRTRRKRRSGGSTRRRGGRSTRRRRR
jgi:hypothetical protein